MSQNAEVYDLGVVGAGSAPRMPTLAPVSPPRPTRVHVRRREFVPRVEPGESVLPGGLSLLLPGSGQIARGEVAKGFFILTFMAFLGVAGWAIYGTADSLAATLTLLGYPPAVAVWMLGALYSTGALVHMGSVVSASPGRTQPHHPALAGLASLIVPGWGQILNGNRARAVLFLGSLWLVGSGWLLSMPAAQQMLDSMSLDLPLALTILAAPLARWLFPAVVWTLAVYDAAASAASRR